MACAVTSDGEKVYMAGTVKDGAVLLPDPSDAAKVEATSYGGDDIFVAQYQTTDGTLNYAKQLGTRQDDSLGQGTSLATNANGDAIVVGNTNGSLMRVKATPFTTNMFVLSLARKMGHHLPFYEMMEDIGETTSFPGYSKSVNPFYFNGETDKSIVSSKNSANQAKESTAATNLVTNTSTWLANSSAQSNSTAFQTNNSSIGDPLSKNTSAQANEENQGLILSLGRQSNEEETNKPTEPENSLAPTQSTTSPTNSPTPGPTALPTVRPSSNPTLTPTTEPTSSSPTVSPTNEPTTASPFGSVGSLPPPSLAPTSSSNSQPPSSIENSNSSSTEQIVETTISERPIDINSNSTQDPSKNETGNSTSQYQPTDTPNQTQIGASSSTNIEGTIEDNNQLLPLREDPEHPSYEAESGAIMYGRPQRPDETSEPPFSSTADVQTTSPPEESKQNVSLSPTSNLRTNPPISIIPQVNNKPIGKPSKRPIAQGDSESSEEESLMPSIVALIVLGNLVVAITSVILYQVYRDRRMWRSRVLPDLEGAGQADAEIGLDVAMLLGSGRWKVDSTVEPMRSDSERSGLSSERSVLSPLASSSHTTVDGRLIMEMKPPPPPPPPPSSPPPPNRYDPVPIPHFCAGVPLSVAECYDSGAGRDKYDSLKDSDSASGTTIRK